MRPGLLCPGRLDRQFHPGATAVGFNEAGAFMPRKAIFNNSFTVLLCSFNEAGAFMPRKAHRRPAPSISQRGFNEAGAFMPRKG